MLIGNEVKMKEKFNVQVIVFGCPNCSTVLGRSDNNWLWFMYSVGMSRKASFMSTVWLMLSTGSSGMFAGFVLDKPTSQPVGAKRKKTTARLNRQRNDRTVLIGISLKVYCRQMFFKISENL